MPSHSRRTDSKSEAFLLSKLNGEQGLASQSLLPFSDASIDETIQQLEDSDPIPQSLLSSNLSSLIGDWQLVYASNGTIVTRPIAKIGHTVNRLGFNSLKCRKYSVLEIVFRYLKGSKSLIQQMQKLDFLNFRTTNSNTETTDLSSANLNRIDLSGVDLSGANLRYANLRYANLSGANFKGAEFRYADLSGADLRYTNLIGANLKYANLSDANLNCTLLSDANLSDANLSRALLFFVNLREVLNLEPLQLKAKPSPFLCNVALPNYSQQVNVNPNRACGQIPQLLSDRYNISLEEAQWIVDEARQHQWN